MQTKCMIIQKESHLRLFFNVFDNDFKLYQKNVNGKPHTWSKKVPPFQAASINYSNVFNLQYSGIFSDHGSKSSM